MYSVVKANKCRSDWKMTKSGAPAGVTTAKPAVDGQYKRARASISENNI